MRLTPENSKITNPILQSLNLSVKFGHKSALNNVSVALERGKICSILGRSGEGKSTLALALSALLPQNATCEGDVILNGANISNHSLKELLSIRGNKIGYIFQDPTEAINPLMKVGHILDEALTLHNPSLTKSERLQRIHEVLDLVDISEIKPRLDNFPFQFSGGQLQRIMIAAAIINNPDALVADEITASLDPKTEESIAKLLVNLSRNLNIAIINITHNFELAKNISDYVYIMHGGSIIWNGSARNIDTSLEQLQFLSPPTSPICPAPSNEVILKVENLCSENIIKRKVFGKNITTANLKNINFNLRKGEALGVIGSSGSGKTSLIKSLLNFTPSSGHIEFMGSFFDRTKDVKNLRKNMQIVFQNPHDSINPRHIIKDVLQSPLKFHYPQMSQKHINEEITTLIRAMSLPTSILHKFPHQLSGGMKQKIALIRALLLKPALVLLDEATSALDNQSEHEVIQILKSYQREHKMSFIFVSHRTSLINSFANTVITLKEGEIVEKRAQQA